MLFAKYSTHGALNFPRSTLQQRKTAQIKSQKEVIFTQKSSQAVFSPMQKRSGSKAVKSMQCQEMVGCDCRSMDRVRLFLQLGCLFLNITF